MNFRQVHIDFHTSEAIADIGKKFDKKQFQEALKTGHVNSVTLFAKCHHGWSYYPSKINPMHPNLDFDLLGAQIEAAKEIGVSTKIYVSAGFDEKTAREHPEWLFRRIDEGLMWSSAFSRTGYHMLCMNSPYLDVLCDEVKEVCTLYECDAIFLDITHIYPCYCQNCVRSLRSEGLDPYDEKNAREFAERRYKTYAKRIREAIDSVNPKIGVFHNGGHIARGRMDLAYTNSHLEIEALPTGSWGYDYFPQSARYFHRYDLDVLGMTGKFHTRWGEFGGFKHPNALRYEVLLNAALGAKSSIGDQLHPSGEADMATYRLIGAAYGELEKKEPWFENVDVISDIGVISTEAISNDVIGDNGAVRILHEGHYLFDFVDAESDFDRYKVIVLPDLPRMSQSMAQKLKGYCERGGKVLATGISPLLEDEDKIALELGGKWIGEQDISVTYIRPVADNKYLDDAGYIFYDKAFKVEPASEDSMMLRMEQPYFERTVEHFCSHMHAPNSGEYCGAAMTRGKDGICIPANVFTEYVNKGTLLPKYMVFTALDTLLGEDKTVRVDMPSQGKITLTEQPKEKRYVCNLLYMSPIHRADVEVIEDIVPLYNVPLEIKLTKRIKKVYLAPSKEKIDFVQKNDIVSLCVPQIDCHSMVVLEY